jgi:hypothetical protein
MDQHLGDHQPLLVGHEGLPHQIRKSPAGVADRPGDDYVLAVDGPLDPLRRSRPQRRRPHDAVRAGDTSGSRLRGYEERINASWVRDELYPVRNVHQAFGHGLIAGLLFALPYIVRGFKHSRRTTVDGFPVSWQPANSDEND